MYVVYNKENLIVDGASSSSPENLEEQFDFLEIEDLKLEMKFYVNPNCWKVDIENKSVVLQEDLLNLKKEKQKNRLTEEQELGQDNTALRLELMQIKLMLGFPITKYIQEDYWIERYNKKYVSQSQVQELKELGIFIKETLL